MSSVRGDREETGTPLAAKPELELSLFLFLYFDSHQIHAGSLGGGFWPEINASAIFFLSLFFFLVQLVPPLQGGNRRSQSFILNKTNCSSGLV